MNNDRELMQEALDALTYVGDKDIYSGTIDALRARLAQPEQEPVAWRFHDRNMWCYVDHLTDLPQDKFKPLYTAPPQREWQGLTDEEYELMAEKRVTNYFFNTLDYAHDIEAKLKEKNSG
jgi:hypothetical protein